MKYIGIHDGHNASACVLENGETKFAIQEERFTYEKDQGGLPFSSIEVIKENYSFSVGPGGTKYELYSSMPYMANTHQEWMILKNVRVGEIGQASNFYLFYFSDLGIFGFILSLIFPIILFNLTYKLMRKLKLKLSSKYFLVVGIYCTGIFMFIRGIFEPQNLLSFGGISADLTFWLLISIVSYYYSKHIAILKPGAIQE